MTYLKAACLAGSLCAIASLATPASAQTSNQMTESSAYVYVSFTPQNSSVNEIVGFEAGPKGALTNLPGSPYTADVTNMAVNGKYLFAANVDGLNIDSYHIADNGALNLWSQTDVANFNNKDCGTTGALFLDHTGKTLYDMEFNGNICANNKYESLKVDSSVGKLTPLGSSTYTYWLTQGATFTGDNQYAYSVSCLYNMYWAIFGEKREANGLLTPLSKFNAALPANRSDEFWCPSLTAADPSNHIAMVLQPVNNSTFVSNGGAQIASYTVGANGSLSTTNTVDNMPTAVIGTPIAIKMAPSGKLLAVSGSAGMQLFFFNGAEPATTYAPLLTGIEIDQMFWDNQNHLYALSRVTGQLFVYTITPTEVLPAPGSPYSVPNAKNVIVQPLPLPRR